MRLIIEIEQFFSQPQSDNQILVTIVGEYQAVRLLLTAHHRDSYVLKTKICELFRDARRKLLQRMQDCRAEHNGTTCRFTISRRPH